METDKDILYFCNAAIFYDFKNTGIMDELNQARIYIINNFQETKPVSRKLKTLSIINVVILKTNNNDIKKIIENIHDLRANILSRIGLEKVVKVYADKVMK